MHFLFVTNVFGMSFFLNKLSYVFGMSVGEYTWYVISLYFFVYDLCFWCHFSLPKLATFLVRL